MRRIITSISFDLSARLPDEEMPKIVPRLALRVAYVTVQNGKEEPTTTTLRDAEALPLLPDLARVNAALDALEQDVKEPGTVAARVAAATEATEAMRRAQEGARAAEARQQAAEAKERAAAAAAQAAAAKRNAVMAESIRIDAELAKKRAELEALKATRA